MRRFPAGYVTFIKFVVKSAFKSVTIGHNRSRDPCRGLEMRVGVKRDRGTGHVIGHSSVMMLRSDSN
ncbi:MAG: hypothetical protein JWL69_4190 [Phycisphaerales bacterium]|nr:hypothetical protein [Phycisphaerales bacterium]